MCEGETDTLFTDNFFEEYIWSSDGSGENGSYFVVSKSGTYIVTVTDTNGKTWRVDTVITGAQARRAQIQRGYGQINLSPVDSDITDHMGIGLPEYMIDEWIAGKIKCKVSDQLYKVK